ncbi:MAG: YbaB/EbfC family nucleoid-associated protein [Spirochaetes bacterium]|jgi:DNA-binding YbaB/EbfC family protein|nr:YbaB/EbfC family nucleoid-associated protein [Spirochaetota bacterium]
MLKGLGDLANIMKMQSDLKDIKKRISKTRMEGGSPDGGVTAVVDGENRLVDLKIGQEYLAGADAKTLEKAVMSAVNEAADKIREFSVSEMQKLAGDMKLPGLGNFSG